MARGIEHAKRVCAGSWLMLAAACYAPQKQAPIPMPLRLVSTQPFTLELDASSNTPATTCVVRRADLDVQSLVGDTIRFSAVRAIEVPPLHPVCGHRGAGMVITSKYPELKAEKAGVSAGRTWLAILVAVPATFGLLVVASLLLYAGN